MDMIVFDTMARMPLAVLLLSTPVAPQRDCVFTHHPQVDAATLTSKEGKIVFAQYHSEYPCHYSSTKSGTEITFVNQDGWHFTVRIKGDNEGTWSANREAETISGRAVAPFSD
jgi:hypothetical protein